jgi:hypothetical protein
MAVPPKEKHSGPDEQIDQTSNWAEDQREHGYYYDDAHGYEDYDPEQDDEASGGGSVDVDLDRTPPLLIEPDKAEKEP